MAFAAVLSLAQTIDQILNDDQYPISVHGKQKIASMREQVHYFENILELENFPEEASSLERRMRNAANGAEDILEHFMYEQIRLRRRLSRATAAGIAKCYSSSKQYDFDELKWVMKEMDSIDRDVMAIRIGAKELRIGGKKLTDYSVSIAPAVSSSSSSVVSPGQDNIVVGFHEDLLKIKEMLCGEPYHHRVISIVGMAGIGKTTLARMTYNDPLIQQHFDICVWVTFSQDHKIQDILRNLLHAMNDFEAKISVLSINSMRERVRMKLSNKRYLIVFDDMWRTYIRYYQLLDTFPKNVNGSRILITTRLMNFYAYFGDEHHMRFMSVDESWNLLQQKVFKKQAFNYELEKIGREIAGKCGGLPLAIELIAGVLSVSKTPASWEKIAGNVSSALYESNDGQFEKIISLSYTDLPHHLRPCFLYMGGFPEDYEIHVSKHIKLWIAEGFVKPPSYSSKSIEVAAEEYLEDIVDRSLALVTKRKPNGLIKSCSIHNLVRDFCKRKAQEENLQCRLSIAHSDLKSLAKTHGSTIRSVVCFEANESSLDCLRKMRLLRVLDVVDANSNVYSLPAQVFELFHLRYLAFGCPMKIPPAISMLQNLQTLIIRPRNCSNSMDDDEVYLPLEVWMMPQLRHLVSFSDILPEPEETYLALPNLQTLSVVKKFVCSKRLLERNPHLKKLGIAFFGDKYVGSCQLDNLVYLDQLETLKLLWNRDSNFGLKVNPVYPEKLKKLTLSGWRLPWKHMEVVGSLPNLQVLKLRHYACQGDTWVTTEEQFRRLKYLLIDESDIQHWVTGDGHFPMLRWLVIYRCPLLSEISNSIAKSHRLHLIEVGNGNDSLVESAKRIQEEQHDLGNYYPQFRFVPDQEARMG